MVSFSQNYNGGQRTISDEEDDQANKEGHGKKVDGKLIAKKTKDGRRTETNQDKKEEAIVEEDQRKNKRHNGHA